MSADRAPFTIPYYRRPHATVDSPVFDRNNNFGNPLTKDTSILP